MSARDAQRLAAGLDEDERAARAATQWPWKMESNASDPYWNGRDWEFGENASSRNRVGLSWRVWAKGGGGLTALTMTCGESDSGGRAKADMAHIVRHDPSHVLADIAAKRAILALYEEFTARRDQRQAHPQYAVEMACEVLESVVKALAGVYQDAPAETVT